MLMMSPFPPTVEEMNAAPHQAEDVAMVSHSSHADQDVSVAHILR